jgi:hypothetical protein
MEPADDDREQGQQHKNAWTVDAHPKAEGLTFSAATPGG